MPSKLRFAYACAWLSAACASQPVAPKQARTMDQVLAASKPDDWRSLDPERTLHLELPAGVIVIELAPEFAPRHVDNIRTLVRERFYDGLPILHVQDNFVVQWGDGEGTRSVGSARRTLSPEFTRTLEGVPFQALPDRDAYAPQSGFAGGLPAARDPDHGTAWATHCYGMVGAGRDEAADSGGGTELYVVSGHAPRQLDRNVTLVGRVVQGMELLSALPRGRAALGFYDAEQSKPLITRVRLAADVPADERMALELLRTGTPAFSALVEARRNRTETWYKVPAGSIDVCNVPLPVRRRP